MEWSLLCSMEKLDISDDDFGRVYLEVILFKHFNGV